MESQKFLFEVIKSKIFEYHRLVDTIEDLLGISTDSAYRRIRGEKELSFSEIGKLCSHFGISMDEIFGQKNSMNLALFKYTSVDLSHLDGYITYMNSVSTALKAGLDSNKEFFFTAQDIPFYHFTDFLELSLFKLYAWNDTVNNSHVSFKEFCDSIDKDRLSALYKEISELYLHIPAKEIWTNQTIDTVLRLVDYYTETGAFSDRETVLNLLDQLSQLIDNVNRYAENRYKGKNSSVPFFMYLCHVDLENNFMLTKVHDQYSCSIKLFTINSIITDNEKLCAETMKWIESLISKSVLISGASAKERFRFFQTSKNKINNLMNKIQLSDMFE